MSLEQNLNVKQSQGFDELGKVHDKPLSFIFNPLSHLISTEANKCILCTNDTAD